MNYYMVNIFGLMFLAIVIICFIGAKEQREHEKTHNKETCDRCNALPGAYPDETGDGRFGDFI